MSIIFFLSLSLSCGNENKNKIKRFADALAPFLGFRFSGISCNFSFPPPILAAAASCGSVSAQSPRARSSALLSAGGRIPRGVFRSSQVENRLSTPFVREGRAGPRLRGPTKLRAEPNCGVNSGPARAGAARPRKTAQTADYCEL